MMKFEIELPDNTIQEYKLRREQSGINDISDEEAVRDMICRVGRISTDDVDIRGLLKIKKKKDKED